MYDFFFNVILFFRLVMVGVPVNHFSHVFVDEAGQGLESETVIAIAGYFNFKLFFLQERMISKYTLKRKMFFYVKSPM